MIGDFSDTEAMRQSLKMISKAQADILIEAACKDNRILDNLYRISTEGKSQASWRASWVLVHLQKQSPEALDDYEQRIIKDLPKLPTDRQRISFLQILLERDFCTDEAGELFDLAMQNLLSAGKQMYVAQVSLRFLEKFITKEPDLAGEVEALIEGENNLPGNYSIGLALKRIRRTLKVINKKD